MSSSEVYVEHGEPFIRPPDPRVVYPIALVTVHFPHHVAAGHRTCTVYRRTVQLAPGSGYAQAIDRLLNHDADGHPTAMEGRPLGEGCTEGPHHEP